jgi:lysophospholipase L1-like esterase
MLRIDEWGWWPLAPWLAWQGWRALRSVPRLAPPAGPDGTVTGSAPPVRLLGLGDSTIAGVGCATHDEALTGRVAALLAARTGRAVTWHARGVSGATASDVRRALLPAALAWAPDAVVVSVGVNDAVRGRAPRAVADDLVAIAAAFGPVPVVYAGMAPVGSFPALRPPLATLLAARARRIERAAAQACAGRVPCVQFPESLERGAFAGDGFHPGPAGCAAWAGWVVEALLPRLR